jgi:hypothetical protein
MLTEAEVGGLFNYFPNLRRKNGSLDEVAEEHFAIQQALEGNLPIQPDALAIFNGHHALHRVSVVSPRHDWSQSLHSMKKQV